MSTRFVYVTADAPRDADAQTMHAAGCGHLRKIDPHVLVPLDASTVTGAVIQIQFERDEDVRVISCTRRVRN